MRLLISVVFLFAFSLPAWSQGYSYDTPSAQQPAEKKPVTYEPSYRYDLSANPSPPQIEEPGRPRTYDYSAPPPVQVSRDARPPLSDPADKPAYCNDLPDMYEKAGLPPPPGGDPLPRFASRAVKEYKVQCAILRKNHPANFPFHPLLVARWRPCEEVWVVESRDSFKDRSQAEQLQGQLKDLGYRGAYIVELIGYEGQ